MVIAIDGPAGCGKSTIAKRLAKELNLYYLNTGSFYRAYTYASLIENVDPLNKDEVLSLSSKIKISVENSNICINGKNVESQLHTPEVDKYCSQVSVDPRLREKVNQEVRKLSKGLNLITEGRDTTTVIFPDATYKFYFDASAEERAYRRLSEQKNENFDDVLKGILERDKNDKEKPVGALKMAKDAIYIDTSNLTIDQVCEKVKYAMQM